jgi:hypothetical protein
MNIRLITRGELGGCGYNYNPRKYILYDRSHSRCAQLSFAFASKWPKREFIMGWASL